MTLTKFFNSFKIFGTSPLESITFLTRLDTTLKEIVMNQAELKAALETVQANQEATQATLTKVVTEVQVLITALANSANALDPSVEAAVNKLILSSGTNSELAAQLDGLNPDAAPVDMVSVDGSSPS